jgi:outer membrane protein assembly factor BamB
MALYRRFRISRLLTLLGATLIALSGCASDWPAFRHNILRSANQLNATAVSDPTRVSSLQIGVGWPFQPPGAAAFRASPIVYNGRVYIGNGNGRFYALDAVTGALLWQYPPLASPALTSSFTCNPSSVGIASSATIARIGGTDAVIFGAPDPTVGSALGEGRLFALNAVTGAVIWKSPVIAHLTGLGPGDTHEQIGYSSPLVFNDRVYVGIADHCDDPIQRGKVVAVRLDTGAVDGAFSFVSTGPPRGGGVWSSVAAWIGGLYVTTGNVNIGGPEPVPNHGLSLLRLNPNMGSIIWKFQPVPYVLDGDPDWSAGATVMLASCGTLIASTMKDGWTYAVNEGSGAPGPPSVKWVFPPHPIPFTMADGTVHSDTRYLRPGAAWGDVYITMTGGLNVTTSVTSGYRRLHALNACASEADRIRWIIDVPGASGVYALGPATVSRGIVFVGTNSGRLIVIADPSIWPGAGWRCSNPDVPNATCLANGFTFVPEPSVLANIQLDGQILTEPAVANGRVYVGTNAGKLYMLAPSDP